MSDFNGKDYLGEIRMFSGNFAPANWALCDGELLLIEEYQDLYSKIGTDYGGDGRSTFALPDMRGRVPVHMGKGAELSEYKLGDKKGEETVKLGVDELPKHNHRMNVDTMKADKVNPENCLIVNPDFNLYCEKTSKEAIVAMADKSLSEVGQNMAHNNLQPTLSINFIIRIQGGDSQDSQDSQGSQGSQEEIENSEVMESTDQFIGEIRIFPYDFVPQGWIRCNGSNLRITEHATLYSIVHNNFGGDGLTSFGLPDMRGHIPMHENEKHRLGQSVGADQVKISIKQMPSHTHGLMTVDKLADTKLCGSERMLARANIPDSRNLKAFCKQNKNPVNLDEEWTIEHIGGSKPHNNMQPSIALQYCIADTGIYPQHK